MKTSALAQFEMMLKVQLEFSDFKHVVYAIKDFGVVAIQTVDAVSATSVLFTWITVSYVLIRYLKVHETWFESLDFYDIISLAVAAL